MTSPPVRLIALWTLTSYLLATTGAVWTHTHHAHHTAETCRPAACQQQRQPVRCCAHDRHAGPSAGFASSPAEGPGEGPSPADAPVHDHDDCPVCQVLAQKSLSASDVPLSQPAEFLGEAAVAGVTQPDSPCLSLHLARGPPA